jgi:predicted kinase
MTIQARTPEVIFTIGFAGCGKSTWLERFLKAWPERQYQVLSSDAILMEYAEHAGITYHDAHIAYADDIKLLLIERMKTLFANNVNVILDQTHLDPQVRADKLALVPAQYHRKAVLFDVPLEVILQRQQAPERLAVGKFIPKDVMNQMIAVYRKPDLNEFDEIVIVSG